MIIKFTRSSVPSLITVFSTAVQVCLIVISCFAPRDTINYAMYINNYVLGFSILLTLCFKGMAKHLLAIAFFACFMLFLMAQKPFEPEYNVYLTFARVQLDTAQYFTFSTILFIGLSVTYYSYVFFCDRSPDMYIIQKLNVLISMVKYQNLRPYLTVMLAITLPCAFYMQGYIVLIRGSMAYTSGYLINVDMPAFIKVGYYLYATVVLLYLAIKPPKGQMLFVLITYLIIEGGLQVFQGRRALFASTLLFIIWYLVKYYGIKRFNPKLLFGIGAVFAALLVVLIVVERARDNASGGFSLRFIRQFLISTGGSDSVIANTIYRADAFPESGLTYLLDPFLNNPLVNILLGKTSSAQGMTYLQQHHSFSHWISYMTDSSLYLSGHGMGSSYLAEVWLALGMAGVFIASILIGWVIHKLNTVQFTDNVFRSAFIFFLVRRLFTLPRDGMFSWVSSLLYMLFTFCLVYPFYTTSCKQGLPDRRREDKWHLTKSTRTY